MTIEEILWPLSAVKCFSDRRIFVHTGTDLVAVTDQVATVVGEEELWL